VNNFSVLSDRLPIFRAFVDKTIDLKMSVEGQELNGYRLVEQIGAGAGGRVWKASKDGKFYALKVSSVDQYTFREISILKIIEKAGGHPGIVRLLDVFLTSLIDVIVDVEDGSERKYGPGFYYVLVEPLHDRNPTDPSKVDQFRVVHRIVSVIEFLQKLNIVHSDIRSDNILWKENLPVVIDFGEAKLLSPELTRQFPSDLEYLEMKVLQLFGPGTSLDTRVKRFLANIKVPSTEWADIEPESDKRETQKLASRIENTKIYQLRDEIWLTRDNLEVSASDLAFFFRYLPFVFETQNHEKSTAMGDMMRKYHCFFAAIFEQLGRQIY
jgi:serine/threonine protein kinase